jgi:two-component system, NtrC family, response regulator HydG
MQPYETTLIGESPNFAAVLRSARLVAATDVTLLILGESGTGKELLARHVHQASRRASKPLVTINCAAIPEALVESELFGHRRGAFSGAVTDHSGTIPAARGGTVLLDEVGELPLNAQAKLLRFLESGECQSVGQTSPTRVDVRVIAATNRDLHSQVQAGQFRADLYFRLHIVPLELPPLRERADDVPLLLETLTAELARRHRLAAPRYSREAVELLQAYRWPGNVRELRNLCERMVVLLSGKTIRPENLPGEIRLGPGANTARFSLPETGFRLDELEADVIRQALCKTEGNRSRAARLLGISRDTLLYRIKKYAIQA